MSVAATGITVLVHDDEDVRVLRDDGAEVTVKVELDAVRRSFLEICHEWLELSKITKRRELELLGTVLYRTLFGGPVDDFLQESLATVPTGERLRLRLSFSGPTSELARFPWEYLYRPGRPELPGYFMATDVNLALSRHLPLGITSVERRPETQLRMLLVVSQPVNLAPVIVQPLIEEIDALSKRYPTMHKVVVDQPTTENLFSALQAFTPHVVHFIGHGHLNSAANVAQIALLAPDAQTAVWLDATLFTEFFNSLRVAPRLLFLQLVGPNVTDIIPQFLLPKIEALVGMQFPITNLAALTFSKAFYRQLLEGNPVDHAVQVGRWRIAVNNRGAYDDPAFGAPVLFFTQGDMGPIQRARGSGVASSHLRAKR